MKHIHHYLLLAIVMLSAASCGSNKNDSKEMANDQNEAKLEGTKMEDDAEFAVTAYDVGMMEIKLGQLAQSRGVNTRVKDLGHMMEEDHSKGNEELKAWAMRKNVTLPSTLSDKAQKKYNKLSELSGTDFDKEYVKCMVDGHQETIVKFEKETENGNDAELKSWAAAKLPILRHHLEMAKNAEMH